MFFFTPQKTTAGFRSAGRSRIYSRNKPQIKQMECFDTSVPRRQSSFRSRRADFALPTLFFSAFLVTRHHCHKLGKLSSFLLPLPQLRQRAGAFPSPYFREGRDGENERLSLTARPESSYRRRRSDRRFFFISVCIQSRRRLFVFFLFCATSTHRQDGF